MRNEKRKIKQMLRIASSALKVCKARHRMVAVGVNHNQIFIGMTKEKTHPLMLKYPAKCVTLHAECDLVIKAGDVPLTSILVYRTHKNGDMALAKPCSSCRELLQKFQPNAKVYYTTGNGIESC